VSSALVPIAFSKPCAETSTCLHRPRADFLAHLIATVAQAPQTRTRRRAEPDEAVAIYDAIERRPAVHRPAFSRWL
jgi:hypothetical protein